MPRPTLKDKIEADASRVFLNPNHFAESISYTPPGGNARPVTGNWKLGETRVDASNGVDLIHPATFKTADTGPFVREGVITVNGEAWPIIEAGHISFGMQTICCERRTVVSTGANKKDKFK